MARYRDVLGIKVEAWGGVVLPHDAPEHPPVLTLNVFKEESKYMEPSKREFMLNFAVDDLDAFVDRLGSGLVDQSQNMTVAASAMAEKKTVGHRS
jgi:hypothetical protein